MNFDIVEIIRQKQQKQPRSICIEDGDPVDISISNGTVIVKTGAALTGKKKNPRSQ